MEIPPGTKVIDLKVAHAWWQDDILHVNSLNVERKMEDYQKLVKFYESVFNERGKFCILNDSSKVIPLSKELRDFLQAEIPKYVKALALISETATGKMVANITLTARKSPYPVENFDNADDARTWLKGFCK